MQLSIYADVLGMAENNQPTEIMEWDQFFMAHALLAAKRSPDAQTKVGAVLVEPIGKTILSSGYNAPVRRARDHMIPNVRPEKYDWYIHAEHNAILNCARLGRSTIDSICYCTHRPCKFCLQYLHQVGVTEIVIRADALTTYSGAEEEFYQSFQFLTYNELKIREIKVADSLLTLADGV